MPLHSSFSLIPPSFRQCWCSLSGTLKQAPSRHITARQSSRLVREAHSLPGLAPCPFVQPTRLPLVRRKQSNDWPVMLAQPATEAMHMVAGESMARRQAYSGKVRQMGNRAVKSCVCRHKDKDASGFHYIATTIAMTLVT